MNLLRLLTIAASLGIIYALMWTGTRVWLNRQRGRNAGSRSEIEEQVCFATALDRAGILRKSG